MHMKTSNWRAGEVCIHHAPVYLAPQDEVGGFVVRRGHRSEAIALSPRFPGRSKYWAAHPILRVSCPVNEAVLAIQPQVHITSRV
jgi:hypothetical protein